jgi:Vitamin K-dependent gamma-carboxylase
MFVRFSSWFQRLFFAPVDALPMRIFERLFTLAFLAWTGRNFLHGREWLTAEGFHLTSDELLRMGYPEAMPLLTGRALPFAAAIVLAAAVAQICNYHRRLALAVLCTSAFYLQAADYLAAFTLNKLFVGIYGVLLLCPGYETVKGKTTISALTLRMVQATHLLQYLGAGLSKMKGDWLQHGDVLYVLAQGHYRTDLCAWMLRHLPVWAWSAMQHTTLLFETGAPLWFCLPRCRPWAIFVGLSIHCMIAVLMHDLIYFSGQMWTFFALWFTAQQWQYIARRVDQAWVWLIAPQRAGQPTQ